MIERIHSEYLEAGADVIETNSFQASRIRMQEWEVGEHTREINLSAARIARAAADAFSTPSRPRFVAGAIGPSGMLPSSDDPALSGVSRSRSCPRRSRSRRGRWSRAAPT